LYEKALVSIEEMYSGYRERLKGKYREARQAGRSDEYIQQISMYVSMMAVSEVGSERLEAGTMSESFFANA
jgi:hypothetical protein